MTEGLKAVGLDGLAIDRKAEVPIGVQLAWVLRSRIGRGDLERGQRLPGLHELAERVGVNVNTVRGVYQQLEREGLIESQQGSGTFVASTLGRASAVATIAADAARAAHETGVEPREVAAALYVSPDPGEQPADGTIERRRELREQIATLERTRAELEAKHPGVAPAHPKTRDDVIGPVLLDVAELERAQTTLVRRLAIVQAAIDQLGAEDQLGTEEIVCEEEPRAAAKGSRSVRARPTTRPAAAGA